MNNRERLTQMLDTLRMPEGLHDKTLDAMRAQKRRRVSFEGFGRWAAITAAAAVLALGGSLMWRYLSGDLNGPAAATAPPPAEGSPGPIPVLDTDIRPDVALYPAMECHIIKGNPPKYIDGRALFRGDQTMIFYDMDDLSRFIYEYNIDDGFVGVERHGISEYIDFSRKMVIAAFGFGSSSSVLLPPVVAVDGQNFDITRRTEPYNDLNGDLVLRGYFLVVDRVFSNFGEIRYHADREGDFDFGSGQFQQVGPSYSNGVRLFREEKDSNVTYVVPPDGVVVALPYGGQFAANESPDDYMIVFTKHPPSPYTAIYSVEHMTGIEFTLKDALFGLWITGEGEEYTVSLADTSYQYKPVAEVSMTPNGEWLVVWLNEEPPQPEPSPKPLDYEPIQLDMSQFLIDIDWPGPAVYSPEFNAFPLTSSSGYYKTHMSGPVTFVDAQCNTITLPFQPTWYAPVRNDNGVVAYALFGHDNGRVLMLADGTVPRGADGEYIYVYDFYENSYLSVGSLVCIYRTVHISNEEGTRPLFGLYDMESRRELLPCEYDWIETIHGELLYVSKGGRSWLLDAKGNELYAFAEGETSGIDTPYSQSWNANYYLDIEERLFCKIPVIDGVQLATLERFGDYYVTRDGGGMDEYGPVTGPLYVFDASGREVHRARHIWHTIGEHLIITTKAGFDVMDKSGTVRHFPYPINYQVVAAGLVLDEVYWTEIDGSERHYAVDEAGHVRSTEKRQKAEEWNGTIDDSVYHDYTTGLCSIRGANGQILLETEEYLWPSGNYIVRYRYMDEHRFQKEAYAVYNLNGELLINDVFGVIWEVLAPNGGIFVYLDANTCVLLYQDGRTEPVPNAPVVEKVWYGG